MVIFTLIFWRKFLPGTMKLSCSALPAAKFFFAISKRRMASNVLSKKTFRNHNNLNCDRIFRAKRQLSLIPLNRTAALPAALSNLTRPWISITVAYTQQRYSTTLSAAEMFSMDSSFWGYKAYADIRCGSPNFSENFRHTFVHLSPYVVVICSK